MRRLFFLAVWLICGALHSSITYFGPETFVRETGGPNSFSRQFSLCRLDGSYTLHVVNGDASGANRVSSASVVVNGQEIVKPSDLNQKVERLDCPIAIVAEQNVLEIRLTSNPGGKVTIEVTGELGCGLDVAITAPLTASIVSAPWVIIKGTLESASPDVGIVVNGIAAELDYAHQGYGSDPYPWGVRLPVAEGPITVIARAKDEFGNEDSAVINLVVVPSVSQFSMTVTPKENSTAIRTDFSIEGLEGEFAELTIDYEGDGQVDAVFSRLPDAIYHYYQPPGLYFPKARFRNVAGNWYEAEDLVIRHFWPAIDGMLRRKWIAFRRAIASGNIESIKTFYTDSCWQRHAEVIQIVALHGALDSAANAMAEIHQESNYGGHAGYIIIHDYNGKKYGSYLYFEKCGDGFWRIDDF